MKDRQDLNWAEMGKPSRDGRGEWGAKGSQGHTLEEERDPCCLSSSSKCLHSDMKNNTEIPPNLYNLERLVS